MSDYDDHTDPDEQPIDAEIDSYIDSESTEVEPASVSQHTLLSYATANDILWNRVSRILAPEYFNDEYKAVVRFVQGYMAKYKKLPSRVIVKSETGVMLDTPDDHMDEPSMQYICDKLESHCQESYSDLVAIKITDITGGEEKGNVLEVIKEASDKLARMKLHQDLGFEVHDSVVEQLKYAETHDNISTGFKLIDRALGGGTTRPSFNMLSAGSGIGKSVGLQNLAVNYVESGENVLYITLELIPPLVEKRFAAMMTNTNIDDVYRNMEQIAVTMRNRGRTEGRLWATKLAMSGTDPNAVASLYYDVCREHKIRYGVVLVDYIDVMTTLRPGVKADNIHLKDKFVAEDLNSFFHDNDLIGWSASQQTKGADDDKNARQSGVSGGAPKVWALDNLFIIKRSEDDMADQRMWVHVGKGRSGGTSLKVPVLFNRDTLRMTDGSESDFYDANPWFFGKKKNEAKAENGHSDRIKNDPLLGGVADKLPVAENGDNQAVSNKATADTIRERLAKVKKTEDK